MLSGSDFACRLQMREELQQSWSCIARSRSRLIADARHGTSNAASSWLQPVTMSPVVYQHYLQLLADHACAISLLFGQALRCDCLARRNVLKPYSMLIIA